MVAVELLRIVNAQHRPSARIFNNEWTIVGEDSVREATGRGDYCDSSSLTIEYVEPV